MQLGKSRYGLIGVLAKRGMDVLLRYHTHYQGQLNLAYSRFMLELEARQAEQSRQIEEQARQLEELRSDAQELIRRGGQPSSAQAETVSMARHENLVEIVAGIDRRVVNLSARLDTAPALEAVRDQAVAVRANVDAVRSEIALFRERVRALQSHVAALHDDIGGLQRHMTALEEYAQVPPDDAWVMHDSSHNT